ncbi:PTS sugar transporter subunit IIC [Desulfocurvus vexinensis]|uniref:PTS sugar transporter subunit IIC n=1 Tax=Desulfocurvus vexinensis TaxID=399548 RepID=UPI000A043A2E|nr:PTS sugar transporter subunit IIC [Desulfocurvus vexinensis]
MDAAGEFFFAVFSSLRFSLNLGILERPLVQGLLWGLLTGDVTQAVSVALVFELLWLDLIPAGTFIPPNPAAGNLAALALMSAFGLSGASGAVFPILIGLPLSWMAAGLERVHRAHQNAAFDTLQHWLAPERQGAYNPGLLVRRALTRSALAHFLFFLAALGGAMALAGVLLGQGLMRPAPGLFSWGQLWLGASVGGLLSLRVPRAYAVMALCALVVAVAGFLG